MLNDYRIQAAKRKSIGIPPRPLTADQTLQLCELLQSPPSGESEFLLHLLSDGISPGVDAAAGVESQFSYANRQREFDKSAVI